MIAPELKQGPLVYAMLHSVMQCDTAVSVLSDHNKTHAADVLHAVSYLLFEIIPEFSHEFSDQGAQREWKVGQGALCGYWGGADGVEGG